MSCFRINSIENFHGNQIIIALANESTGETEMPSGGTWTVRVPITDAPEFIHQFITAYTQATQNVMLNLAAGGCRTCDNKRRVNGGPCPVCIPRAEDRIRKHAFVFRGRDR